MESERRLDFTGYPVHLVNPAAEHVRQAASLSQAGEITDGNQRQAGSLPPRGVFIGGGESPFHKSCLLHLFRILSFR